MSQKFQAPRGMNDFRPGPIVKEPEFEIQRWHHVESIVRELSRLYGYQEIRTPILEDIELFLRSSGETSDIVSKEMYDFVDKGGRHVAMRPEGTAPAIRAYLEHSLGGQGGTTRLYYLGPMFRYGRPQRGRYRQLHQAGFEIIGSQSVEADAEIIEVTHRFFLRLGLTSLEVLINSIGRAEDREKFAEAILAHLSAWLRDQAAEDRARAEKNPLRLLDTKSPVLQEALADLPSIEGFLGDASKVHFDDLQARLTEADVPFRVDRGIVRGLDYYSDTVFEFTSPKLGAQSSLCGGGRYDGLVKQLGGPPTPCVGVGIGLERAIIVALQEGVNPDQETPAVFIVAEDDADRSLVRTLARRLREAGIACQSDLDGKKRPQQLKQADRVGARRALIVSGETLTVRDMQTGAEAELTAADLTHYPWGAA